jgi:hypothetical protein
MANVTIVLPISRPDFLKRIFAQLEFLACDANSTNLVTIVDGNQQLVDMASALTEASKFKQKICRARGKGIPSSGGIRQRRNRIAVIHNEIRAIIKNIPSDYVFSLEDDTLFPTNTLERLLAGYRKYPHAGFITGMQLGRWGFAAVGVWYADDVYDTDQLTSLRMDTVPNDIFSSDVIRCDAAGLYGCLIKKEWYDKHEFAAWMDGAMGPDINMGLAFRREGLLNYVDTSLRFTHLAKPENIEFKNAQIVTVRVYPNEKGAWVTEVI